MTAAATTLAYRAVFCDMDGTLVDTDRANFLAYQQAVRLYCGQTIMLHDGRFTQASLVSAPKSASFTALHF